jgi:hypothetical protein
VTPALAAAAALLALGTSLYLALRPAGEPLDLRELWSNALRPEVPLGRHAAGVTGEWRPSHRRGVGAYRGRHYLGRRTWSANLIRDTSMLTTRELAQLLTTR